LIASLVCRHHILARAKLNRLHRDFLYVPKECLPKKERAEEKREKRNEKRSKAAKKSKK
jgi:hypothetical protein